MVNLEAASLTDTGLIRGENEDSVWEQVFKNSERDPLGLFIVCDGMGGHMGGKFASYWAVEAIKHEFGDLFQVKDPRATVVLSNEDIERVRAGEMIYPGTKPPDIEAITQMAVQKANSVVYDFARHKPKQAANAGTTVTMAFCLGNQVVIANVGDSRTYLLRNHYLRQISVDHSLVATLVADGQITSDEIYAHPQRNVIYRYVGHDQIVMPDIFHETVKSGDFLLLCSDGLWEMVRSDDLVISLIETASSPMQACQDLVEAANQAGGEDNIGVVVVAVSE